MWLLSASGRRSTVGRNARSVTCPTNRTYLRSRRRRHQRRVWVCVALIAPSAVARLCGSGQQNEGRLRRRGGHGLPGHGGDVLGRLARPPAPPTRRRDQARSAGTAPGRHGERLSLARSPALHRERFFRTRPVTTSSLRSCSAASHLKLILTQNRFSV